MAHKNKTEISSRFNIPECVMLIAYRLTSRLEKDVISAVPKQNFLPNPTTPNPSTTKAPSNINKTMLSASPSSDFHTKFTISELRSKLLFYSNGI